MWVCEHCGAEVESADWDTCWNCLWSRSGEPPASSQREPAHVQPLGCLRCRTKLQFIGTKTFHEGSEAATLLLGNPGALFVNREEFDLYACSHCGHVEFFLSAIRGDRRPHDDTIG